MLRGEVKNEKVVMINIVSSKGQVPSTYKYYHAFYIKVRRKTNIDAIGQFLIFGVKISGF
jgi:hypothetical protein